MPCVFFVVLDIIAIVTVVIYYAAFYIMIGLNFYHFI